MLHLERLARVSVACPLRGLGPLVPKQSGPRCSAQGPSYSHRREKCRTSGSDLLKQSLHFSKITGRRLHTVGCGFRTWKGMAQLCWYGPTWCSSRRKADVFRPTNGHAVQRRTPFSWALCGA